MNLGNYCYCIHSSLKEFHLFDNEKEAQAFAKKSGGKLVKGVNKSKGKFAVVIEEVKTSFIDDIKEKMLTYSSDLMLNESNLKIVQDIVKRKSAKNIKFKDGSLKVDMFTASALSQIYDKVNTDNKGFQVEYGNPGIFFMSTILEASRGSADKNHN